MESIVPKFRRIEDDIDLIVENLYISNIDAVNNRSNIEKFGIKAVLTIAGREVEVKQEIIELVDYKRIEIDDYGD